MFRETSKESSGKIYLLDCFEWGIPMKTEATNEKSKSAKPTPVLGLLPEMSSDAMDKAFSAYSAAVQTAHAKELGDLNLEMGRKIAALDKVQRDTKSGQKRVTMQDKQAAHNRYQAAARAAKASYDREIATIDAAERTAIGASGLTFSRSAAPVEAELKASAAALQAAMGEKLHAATEEFALLSKAAKAREAEAAKKQAEYRAEMEAKKAAREAAPSVEGMGAALAMGLIAEAKGETAAV